MEFRILQAGLTSYGTIKSNNETPLDLTPEREPVKNVRFESTQFWNDF